jgi:hypothetical protein
LNLTTIFIFPSLTMTQYTQYRMKSQ